jgi:hypothetical protein
LESSRGEEKSSETGNVSADRLISWAKFGLSLLALLTLALVLSKGLTPPGPLGTVLRHNQKLNLDATPLFYTEIEGFEELTQDLPKPQKNK